LSGKDPLVQQFLEEKSEMKQFIGAVKLLVDQSVKNYIDRGFNHLSVSFGCTGGQHRSVYAAEKLAEHIGNNYPVNVVLVHNEQEVWK
jgi:RNase adaptor protein for sRNA GlmZ degradation